MSKANFYAKPPRVLVVVKEGEVNLAHDEGVDVVVFDIDNYEDDPQGTSKVPAHFSDLAGSFIDTIYIPVDCDNPTASNQDKAAIFMSELLAVGSLTSIAEKYDAQTLADLFELQNAIITDAHVTWDHRSSAFNFVTSLPSSSMWLTYIDMWFEFPISHHTPDSANI